jgi:hypothetical protein
VRRCGRCGGWGRTRRRSSYGYQIDAVNRAYGLEASAFTELESSDFARLDEGRSEVVADDRVFAVESIAERIQTGLGAAVKGKIRVLGVPADLPTEMMDAVTGLAEVDAVLFHSGRPAPGIRKAVVLANCSAVKPVFATACLGI